MSVSVATGGAAVPPTPSLWPIDITRHLGPDAAAVANDMLRMLCIQIAIQLMVVMSGDGDAVPLLSADFALLVLYIALGVMLYWLAVRRVVTFV